MILIVGGAYQGKKEYARTHGYADLGEIADGASISREELFRAKAVENFHLFLKRNEDIINDYETFCRELIEKNPELLIITNELGYGVVPLDPQDRKWREVSGRVCCILAEYSTEVIRVVSGLGIILKQRESR